MNKLEDYIDSIDNDIKMIEESELSCCDARELEVLINVRNYLTNLLVDEEERRSNGE